MKLITIDVYTYWGKVQTRRVEPLVTPRMLLMPELDEPDPERSDYIDEILERLRCRRDDIETPELERAA